MQHLSPGHAALRAPTVRGAFLRGPVMVRTSVELLREQARSYRNAARAAPTVEEQRRLAAWALALAQLAEALAREGRPLGLPPSDQAQRLLPTRDPELRQLVEGWLKHLQA
jgi:hypothetical protein